MNDVNEHLLKRFRKYHQENPDVYIEFKELAFKMLNTGRERYSATTIIETIRWHYELRNKEAFKINNDFTAVYSRLFMKDYPQYQGFFKTRTAKKYDRQISNEEHKRNYDGTTWNRP